MKAGSILFAVIIGAASPSRAADTNAVDFREVYDLVRAHLHGATDAELNRLAVEGLLAGLRGKAALIGDGETPAPSVTPLIARSTVIEGSVAYVRVGRVVDGMAKSFAAAIQASAATNQLKGITLDLRFANGDDYAAAAEVADLFLADVKPLLDWGNGVVKSEKKYDILKLQVAVLVNRETAGAAEAMAAVLRETGTGLILGGATAGRAMISQEFPLKTGQKLRLGTTPVRLGSGTPLSPQGVKPDIEVAVSAAEERAYLEDAYAEPGGTNLMAAANSTGSGQLNGTNRPSRRPRPTEADLVRARREGISLDADSVFARDGEPEKPQIRDPVLARAVDLLKGLAVVRKTRP